MAGGTRSGCSDEQWKDESKENEEEVGPEEKAKVIQRRNFPSVIFEGVFVPPDELVRASRANVIGYAIALAAAIATFVAVFIATSAVLTLQGGVAACAGGCGSCFRRQPC